MLMDIAYTPDPLHLRAQSRQTIHGNEHIFVLPHHLYNLPLQQQCIQYIVLGAYNQGRGVGTVRVNRYEWCGMDK